MGRPVILSNGGLLVGLNEFGLVHDFYYPYVGQENLTTARSAHHNLGVWIDGHFSWLDSGEWAMAVDFEDNALISKIKATHKTLPVELTFSDFVDFQYNAFCRDICITNISDEEIEVRLMLHQVFEISHYGRGDTALYVPSGNYVLDYKGWYSLLIYAEDELGQPFDQFSVGNHGIEGKEGTFRDAEDGELAGNLVEHGSVDSTIRCKKNIAPKGSERFSYWIIAAGSQFDAEVIHHMIKNQKITSRLDATRNYWRNWLSTAETTISKYDPKYQVEARKSLMIIKSHCDKNGGIIASCDSSIYNYGRDYYSYVWPRDGALTVLPLIKLGYYDEALKFFKFCSETIHPRGFMMHKYQPDKAIGSTWHPLMHKHHPELAIQEDETASVVYAICVLFEHIDDKSEVRQFYSSVIKPACDFMSAFYDKSTGLPHASYDLWEERFGTHTYTVAIVIASLIKASKVAEAYGMSEDTQRWSAAAEHFKQNLDKLFNPGGNYYNKSYLLQEGGEIQNDETLDTSSFYGLFEFCSDWTDKNKLAQTVSAIENQLFADSQGQGAPRYNGDYYFRKRESSLGNLWFVCSFWLAQYYAYNNREEDALKLIDWGISKVTPSGMMSEQIDPDTKEQTGVSPLVWSHAEYLNALQALYFRG